MRRRGRVHQAVGASAINDGDAVRCFVAVELIWESVGVCRKNQGNRCNHSKQRTRKHRYSYGRDCQGGANLLSAGCGENAYKLRKMSSRLRHENAARRVVRK